MRRMKRGTAMAEIRTDVQPVDITRVRMEGGFWGKRMEINRNRTIPSQYEQLVDTGRLDGLDPDYRPGDADARHKFWDSDVAKWMEAAGYSLNNHPDPELEGKLEEVIGRLGRLQQEDGYLNS